MITKDLSQLSCPLLVLFVLSNRNVDFFKVARTVDEFGRIGRHMCLRS